MLKKLFFHGMLSFFLLAFAGCAPSKIVSLKVMCWNVESGDSDPKVVGQRIEAFQGYDIWGLSEVKSEDWGNTFEKASEYGENADFQIIMGSTGKEDRLLIIYNSDRLKKIDDFEIHEINPSGRVRSPLIAKFQDKKSGQIFFFMVNHLYRGKEKERHIQAGKLNDWGKKQKIPIIAVGDYNFDWNLPNGDQNHDQGYDNMTAQGVFRWIRPDKLIKTQGSDKYNSVLDFIFLGNCDWKAISEIIVADGDFPDDEFTPDHRPVSAIFELPIKDKGFYPENFQNQ